MGKLKAEVMKLLSTLKAGNVTKANKVSGNAGSKLRLPLSLSWTGLEPNTSGSSGEGNVPIQCYKYWGGAIPAVIFPHGYTLPGSIRWHPPLYNQKKEQNITLEEIPQPNPQ